MEEKTLKIVFAGGCFWCTEAVFKNVIGVENVLPVYTGGHLKNPTYKAVCDGQTGHAEGVIISYNPKKIRFIDLLIIFFASHDPTTLNRQGNDVGTQYRSAIFYTRISQKKEIVKYLEALKTKKVFKSPIVTEVKPLEDYYIAEEIHQDYYARNKQTSYCQFIINPKLQRLNKAFAAYYK